MAAEAGQSPPASLSMAAMGEPGCGGPDRQGSQRDTNGTAGDECTTDGQRGSGVNESEHESNIGTRDEPIRPLGAEGSQNANNSEEIKREKDNAAAAAATHEKKQTMAVSVDMEALPALEAQAMRLSQSTVALLRNLETSLNAITNVTGLCAEAYCVAVEQYSHCCDDSMRHMMQLLSKTEELDTAMVPVYALGAQIKAIKRQLDTLESVPRTKK